VADVRVTYDKTADAAYVYLTEPQARVSSARTYPCDPVNADAMPGRGTTGYQRCMNAAKIAEVTFTSAGGDHATDGHARQPASAARGEAAGTKRLKR
jgi:hypothetical protein